MEEKSGRVTDLLDVRGKMFDECLNSICELIVSTSYCGTMLEKGKRMREIRNIKGIIRMYVESEREVLLSYLITFCNVRDEQNQKCEFESLRKKILAATIRPSLAKRLPTKTLLNHFFFEAMFVKSNCFKMRKIILQFVDNFRVSFTSFRKRVNEAMKVIMDRNTRAIELSTSALKEKQKDLAEMQDRVKSLATRLQGFVGDQSDSTSTQEEERVSELEQKLARQKEIISTLKLQLEKVKKELVKARTPKKKQEAFSDDTEKLLDDYYAKEEQDLVVTEINVDTLVNNGISYGRDGELVNLEKGSDYTVRESGSDVSWKEYQYTIDKKNFEEEGHYTVTIDSEDRATNVQNNKVKDSDIEFVIDKTAPSVVITGVENGEQYRADSRDMTVNVADNMAMGTVDIYLGDGITPDKSYKASEIERTGGALTYTIGNADEFQDVRAVARDAAGNEAETEGISVLVTSNLLIQYVNNTPLLVGSIIVVLLIAGGACWYFLIFKKKKNEQAK